MIFRRSVKDTASPPQQPTGGDAEPGAESTDSTQVVEPPEGATEQTEVVAAPEAEQAGHDDPAQEEAAGDGRPTGDDASGEAPGDETDAAAPADERDEAADEPAADEPGEPDEAADEPAADDPDATVVRPVESGADIDATAVRPAEAEGDADLEATAVRPAEPEGDVDSTVVTPVEPEAAETRTEAAPEVDPATAAEPETAATVVRSADPAAPEAAAGPADPTDPEATVVRPAADDPDATAVGAAAPPEDPPAPPAPPARSRRRGRKVLLGVGLGLVVLAGGYAAAAYYVADKVPQGTTVAGVDISGLTAEDAVATLESGLADLVSEPIPVEAGERSATIDPAEAGLALDAEATVDRVTGFTLDPRVVVGHLLGLGAVTPVVEVDETALTDAVTAGAVDLDVAPVDAVLEIADGTSTLETEPADGLAVDVEGSVDLLASEWLTGQRPFTLPSETVEPTLGQEAVDTAMREIVDPLLSGPVTVELNDDTTTSLTPEQLSDAADLVPEGSRFVLQLDGEALADVVTESVPSIGETAKDAQIVLREGKPTIIPAVTGTGLDPEQLATVVTEAALATGEDERVAVAELADTEPEFSTEDAEALGVVEVVGEYSTPFPHDPPRTQNLINGAANINGTLVLPGEEFSLLEALGPITEANGYVSSLVVESGFVTSATGGGLSQISTTVFNAAFEAGMEDIEHKPHSRWFDRYPPGREATMYSPSLDMRWGNNTPYGVLVQAWVDQSAQRVHVRLWSTEHWDVDIVSSEKYAFTSPRTIYNTNPTCRPESAGPSGFTIDIRRTISLDGEVNDQYSRSYSWTYQPWNRVVCGSPPSNDDKDDATEDASDD